MLEYAINNEMAGSANFPPFLIENHIYKGDTAMTEITLSKACPKHKSKNSKKQFSAEHRRKLSEAAKKKWQDPEYRKEMAAIVMTDEGKKSVSDSMKAKWKDPVYRNDHTGHERSKETKQKLSEKAKERWANPEYKTRMSKTMKDSIAERGCSEETRVKLSKAVKKRAEDPAYRKRLSESSKKKWQDPGYRKSILKAREGLQTGENHPMWGREHSEETRQKMRDSHNDWQSGEGHPMFGRRHSEEVRNQMSKSHANVPLSEKHKTSIGKASKKVWATIGEEKKNEWRKKIGDGNKGKVVSAEARKKISTAHKGKHHSPATEFTSESLKKRYQDPEYMEKMAKAWNIKPNKPETIILNLLNDLYPGEWKYTGDFSFTINGKSPDFTNCNGQKKVIEFNGTYWHRNDIPGEREKVFAEFGYDTLIIWENEMEDISSVIHRIRMFSEGEYNGNS
jgi:very-short-patch-repair endonuclease